MSRSKSPVRAGSPTKSNRPGSPSGVLNYSAANQVDTTKIRLNEKGGILVTENEIASAFNFLDVDKTGKVSIANLKKRLSVFFPDMTAKDYRFLMNGKRELEAADLMELLTDNEIVNFDPVAEAFKAYDVKNEGFIEPTVLKEMFKTFGFGELSKEELDVLIKAGDIDGDEKISLEDFRNMLDPAKSALLMPPPSAPSGLFTGENVTS
jgi:calmodulin